MKSFFTHPFMAFVAIVLLCRGLGDFYPFNKFPMYANPADGTSEFVVVADENDKPVLIKVLTGESTAKIKKKYIAVRNDLAKAAGIKDAAKDTPDEICRQAWSEVVGMLRRLAERRKKQLPAVMTLKIGLLYQETDGFREEWVVIGSSKSANPKAN